MSTNSSLAQAVVELKYAEIESLVQSALKAGSTPEELLKELKSGLDAVGEKYHNREYFLSELYMASETMKAALDILTPLLRGREGARDEGVVVIGSISGDIHDFGKTIVSSLLSASGFKVYDLGVDVSPKTFVDEAVRLNADVIGVSALLSSTQPLVAEVVDDLKARGIRERFKVILGGTGVTSIACELYGVDAAVNDASEGIKVIKSWMAEKKHIQPQVS